MNSQNAVQQELKAERVQGPESLQRKVRTAPQPADTITEALTPQQAQQRLKAERVQLRLNQMPTWKVKPGGKVIDRVRQFPDALTTASYLAFAALLARQSGQRLWASVQGNTITVSLPGRAKGGLTEETLDLAEQLG